MIRNNNTISTASSVKLTDVIPSEYTNTALGIIQLLLLLILTVEKAWKRFRKRLEAQEERLKRLQSQINRKY